MPQAHDREDADDADDDDGCLEHTAGDEAEGESLVLALDDRKQRNCSADARERVDKIKERAADHAGVGAGADDVVGVGQDRVQQDDRRDRAHESDQVEDSRNECGSPN